MDLSKLSFSIQMENTTDEKIYVLAKHISFLYNNQPISVDKITFPDTILAALRPKQELHLSGSFILSTPKSEYSKQLDNAQPSGNPGASFSIGFVNVTYALDMNLIEQHIKDLDSSKKIQFLQNKAPLLYMKLPNQEPAKFVVHIESHGPYSPIDMMNKAFDILQQKCLQAKTHLSEKHDDLVDIMKHPETQFQSFDFRFFYENDTIGNLLSQFLVQHPHVTFAGYNIPHPLDQVVYIRIALDPSMYPYEESTYRQFMIEQLQLLHDQFQTIHSQWSQFSQQPIPTTKPSNMFYSHFDFLLEHFLAKEDNPIPLEQSNEQYVEKTIEKSEETTNNKPIVKKLNKKNKKKEPEEVDSNNTISSSSNQKKKK
jgi:DNA-directed RNA polymerase subunit L